LGGSICEVPSHADAEKKIPLHKGMIEVLLKDEDYYVTAGADGFIKWWRISDID
jgi:hypothetical protein